MVGPPLHIEDHTDEDFFDKLVDDDEVDVGGSNEASCLNDELLFANLSVDENAASALDDFDNVDKVVNTHVFSCSVNDCKVDGFDASTARSGSGSWSMEGVEGELSDHDVSVKNESDARVTSDNGGIGSSEIKQVQWGAFSGGDNGTQNDSFADFFSQIGDDSTDPLSDLGVATSSNIVGTGALDAVSSDQATCSTNSSFGKNGEDTHHTSSMEVNKVTEDQNSIQYWESLYPGWKYDSNSGQWRQVDVCDANVNNIVTSNVGVHSTSEEAVVNPTSDAYCLHHTTQSTGGGMTKENTKGTSLYSNQPTYGNPEYPSHMVFDPQYPGWYYDTIAQEWRSLDAYTSSINQSASLHQNQQLSYESFNTVNSLFEQSMNYGQCELATNCSYQLNQSTNSSYSRKETLNMEQIAKNTHVNGFISAVAEPFTFEHPTTGFDCSNGFTRSLSLNVGSSGSQNFTSTENKLQSSHHGKEYDRQFSPASFTGSCQKSFSYEQSIQSSDETTWQPNHHGKEYDLQFSCASSNALKIPNFPQQPLQNSSLSYFASEGRSSHGRIPHALVSFGFGGKLIIMKHHTNLNTQPAFANQDSAGVISILDMMEVSMPKHDGSDIGFGDYDYVRTLCEQSFSGPLVSGSVGSKELNKWIDDRIANSDTPASDNKDDEVLKMVLSVLKIACQYYGKLRSAFGAGHNSKESDCPESALANLFSSATRNDLQFSAVSQCLQNIPSEGQIQATAQEVQMLLVSGKRTEALQCAQKGHLWGPAIAIATLLGEQFYSETMKQMALHQLVVGSPLRTLCLLIAGQPAEVFSNSISQTPQNGVNVFHSRAVGSGCMLDGWEENLAIISANRTNGDELVITHLGDCLWREKGDVLAAHICYLLAEANIEEYSESARLCLVGADHLKYPRTYASPQAIQRTELYEYAKVLGNSQFVLLPFQPYKLIYACMLAEVGKLSDSLKYCQSVLKSLKTSRLPEVDSWRHMVSSLEERIKIYQQGGFTTNFARAKLVGKLLNFFDNTAQRVVGGLPPPTPLAVQSNGQHSEHDHRSRGARVSTSQSTMAISSLMTSASIEGSNHKSLHNRSMSEPDFSRTPRKDVSPKSNSSSPRDNATVSGGSSRFGRFGSQIFQKTVGLVLRSRPDRQAKLGETNKFYYDEKLKRWVEEGAESQIEEMTLAPPPTTGPFMNGMLGHDKRNEPINGMIFANGEPEHKHTNFNCQDTELPPIPSGSNHFTVRGRMGVRARYVDTFNKGGGTPANSFQSPTPSLPAMRAAAANPKFFIPTPVSQGQVTQSSQSTQQTFVSDHNSATSNGHDSFSTPQRLTPLSTIQRHPSMDKGMAIMEKTNGPSLPNSRRTLSWGGSLDLPNHTSMGEIRLPGEVAGFHRSS